jgi:hypothetical protein
MSISKDEVVKLFSPLESGNADAFFARVSPDVDWTVLGTHPLAGRYIGRELFRSKTFSRLTPCLDGPVRLKLLNVYTDTDTAIVELEAISRAKNGWMFDNRYCWILDFSDGFIVRVRAYLDSAMVARLILEHEPAACG